jgi:hypothetical protein
MVKDTIYDSVTTGFVGEAIHGSGSAPYFPK